MFAWGVSGDGMADFIYDPVTGQLEAKPDGESVWSINVATGADAIGTNLPAQWVFADFGAAIEWTDQFAGAFPLTTDFNLGTLPAGLTPQDFGDVTYFVTADFDTHRTSVEVIPEPASLALLGLGGLMMLRRRRTA